MSELKEAVDEARRSVGTALEKVALVEGQMKRQELPEAVGEEASRHVAEVALALSEAVGGLEELGEVLGAEFAEVDGTATR